MTDTFEAIRAFAAAKKAAAQAAPPAVPFNGHANGHAVPAGAGDTPYGMAALGDECATVAAATIGTRDDTINTAAFKMGRLIAGGQLTETTVLTNLEAAARVTGQPQVDIDRALRTTDGGLSAGMAKPRTPTARPPVNGTDIVPPPAAPDFWAARPELAHVHAFARARRACPWAVLGVVLARVIVAVPPWVVLPPLVGADASLNLFIALVAPSGGGKGVSESCAADAINVGTIDTAGVGSGEGIAHLFLRRTKDGIEQHREACLMQVTEIDTLAALGDRKGTTLLPELRKAWSGENLGFAYADPTKALPLHAHKYRLCLVAGVQPGRAQWVLDDAAGGTPQRFLWLPAEDPQAPDEAPPCPAPTTWGRAKFGHGHGLADYLTGRVAMPVCRQARDTIDQARLARLRGDGEALNGHALLTRLKAAAALALLDGRGDVNDEDWELSAVIAEISEHTRTGVVEHLRRDATVKNKGRAIAEAERAITITDQQEADAMKKTGAYILRRLLTAPEGLTRTDLRRGLSTTRRGVLDVTLSKLVEVGQIEADGIRWKVPK